MVRIANVAQDLQDMLSDIKFLGRPKPAREEERPHVHYTRVPLQELNYQPLARGAPNNPDATQPFRNLYQLVVPEIYRFEFRQVCQVVTVIIEPP